MKPDQQKYARQRIKDALDKKLSAIRERRTKRGKCASDEDKMYAVRHNDVDLLNSATLKTPLGKAFDFSSLEPEYHQDDEAIAAESSAVKEEADKIIDEIMLGDEKTAIKLIREFCA